MHNNTQHIAEALKKARQDKGLTQRALTERTGIPQSQISKIEKGAVDLRLSSLVELARALDLELTFVPRKTFPAVQTLLRGTELPRSKPNRAALKELRRLSETISKLSRQFSTSNEFARLAHHAREIQRLRQQLTDPNVLRGINKTLETAQDSARKLDAIRESAHQAAELRNSLLHLLTLPSKALPKPAYSLESIDHD